MLDVRELLHDMMELGADELYLCTGAQPVVRAQGKIRRLDYPKLTPVTAHQSVYGILNHTQRAQLESAGSLDMAFSVPGLSRFRMNVSHVRGAVSAYFRTIPLRVPTVEELELPPRVAALADVTSGLLVFSSPAGGGSSTTLAAVLDRINATRECTIRTIEDPIEFIHEHQKGVIAQQEVGADVPSVSAALTQIARQRFDVVMVSEIRDAASWRLALSIAESGSLLLTTMRAAGAVETVERLLQRYGGDGVDEFRSQLAATLSAVCAQILGPRRSGGRVAVIESLSMTMERRVMVSAGDLAALRTALLNNQDGAVSMERALDELASLGIVDDEAVRAACGPYLAAARGGQTP